MKLDPTSLSDSELVKAIDATVADIEFLNSEIRRLGGEEGLPKDLAARQSLYDSNVEMRTSLQDKLASFQNELDARA